MELLTLQQDKAPNLILETTEHKPFILANTLASNINELRNNHLIPVFVKDNQPVISQADFVELTSDISNHIFKNEIVLSPNIRVSHPIKGRIPEAKDKPAHLLLEEEKTIYYERMAFVIEIPSISDTINGNRLSLTIGGIKAYNLDNMYSRKGTEEHFKLFIGFQNKVCTNLCIATDGLKTDVAVRSLNELTDAIYGLIQNYNAKSHLEQMGQLMEHDLTEHQFAQLIGKARMYKHLPPKHRKHLQELSFGDTQLGMVVREYYNDEAFCRNADGSINLWKLYNLFTGANKSSYIDTFFDRGLNAFSFIKNISSALANKQCNWFLD
ncbi:DUF3871 family protein [Pedobacter nanyangensis]|uniref:DUF3871 family protein n=1 Tax=Pedobacter nanyangensis TaxID=1562389 RepID=UPI000DE3506C|nr:DUF3871 family protein [Pedobacter nanyangensis]